MTIYKIIREGGEEVWLFISSDGNRILLTKTPVGKTMMKNMYPEAKVVGPITEEDMLTIGEVLGLQSQIGDLLLAK